MTTKYHDNKYNPHIKGLKKHILKYLNVLKNVAICVEKIINEQNIVYSKHKSIKEIII